MMNTCLFQKAPFRLVLILVLSVLLDCILAYPNTVFNSYELNDLASPTNVTFAKEAASWKVSNLVKSTNRTSYCNDIPMLGGPGILKSGGYFERTITGLPLHDTIHYKIQIFIIDDWQDTDTVMVTIDNRTLTIGELAASKDQFPADFCGNSSLNDLQDFYFMGRLNHTQENITIRFTSMINRAPTIASFGVGRVNIMFANTTQSGEGDPEETNCTLTNITLASGNCACPNGSYFDTNTSTCLACHSLCSDCFGPLATQCYSCIDGASYIKTKCTMCDSTCQTCSSTTATTCLMCADSLWYNRNRTCTATCDSPDYAQSIEGNAQICKAPCQSTEFFYFNSSCITTCPTPFSTSTSGYGKFCNLPCGTTKYQATWNKTCIAQCPYPLVNSTFESVVKLCTKPCNTGEYFYPNKTCINTCVAPLAIQTINDVEHCVNPCSNGSQYYYQFNLTCHDQCPSPLVEGDIFESIVKLCNQPCNPGEYLYPNGSCISSCPSPLIVQVDNYVQKCVSPCNSSQYFYWNQTCQSECPKPLDSSNFESLVDLCNKPCNTGEYLYPNGSCIANCQSPLTTNITNDVDQCVALCNDATPYFWNQVCYSQCPFPLNSSDYESITTICIKPCSSGEYFYPNGSCSSVCDTPLVVQVENTVDKCVSPCASSEYFYWNQTCQSQCATPLVQKSLESVVTLCNKPCSTGEYLYPNGSCIPKCETPLVNTTTSDGVLKCISPCNTSQYFSWNQSCFDQCPSPLVISSFESIVNLCNKPCYSNEYFYPNKSCLTTCDLPMLIQTKNYVDQCSPPCTNGSYLSTLNSTCLATCNSPSIIKQEDFYTKCIYREALSESEVNYVKTAGSVVDVGQTTISAGTAISAAIGASNPATGVLAGFVKMLPYIRYMKIDFPPKLDLMLHDVNSSLISFSFGIDMPPSIREKFTKHPLPEKFDEYQLHSSFIVNYWQPITSLAILLGIIYSLVLLSLITKRKKAVHQFMNGLKMIVKWNFFLMMFCTNLDGVILNTSLELRTLHLDSFASVMSFLICLAMNAVVFFILGLAFYIVKDIRKAKYTVTPLGADPQKKPINPETKWQEFQLFFKGSKDNTFGQHIFMLPFLMRIYLFNFIISYLFDYPMAQAVLITLLGITLLSYMLWKRPFISQLVFCQHVSDELILLTVNSSILGLTILDKWEIQDSYARVAFGDVVIYCNIAFSITTNIYIALYVLTGFKAAYKTMKVQKKKGILPWLTALLAPFESGGMDIEVTPEKEESPGLLLPSGKSIIEQISPKSFAEFKFQSINLRSHNDSITSSSDLKDMQDIRLLSPDKDRLPSPLRSPKDGSIPPSPSALLLNPVVLENNFSSRRSSISRFQPRLSVLGTSNEEVPMFLLSEDKRQIIEQTSPTMNYAEFKFQRMNTKNQNDSITSASDLKDSQEVRLNSLGSPEKLASVSQSQRSGSILHSPTLLLTPTISESNFSNRKEISISRMQPTNRLSSLSNSKVEGLQFDEVAPKIFLKQRRSVHPFSFNFEKSKTINEAEEVRIED